MSNFTFVVPFYKNPDMLKIQIDHWKHYDKRWEFLVVDDGSPKHTALETVKSLSELPANLSIYKIKEDIPWNAHGARNLGALVAKFGWLFMTDIDTCLKIEDAGKLLEMKEEWNNYYMFARQRVTDSSPKNSHPNTFLVHRSQFWDVGGYDLDFTNCSYGGDKQFTDLLDKKYTKVMMNDVFVQYYPEDHYPGASVRDWPKKDGPFHKEYRDRLRIKNKMGWNTPNTPIRFTWERVL